MSSFTFLWLCTASLVAGFINAIAGGGTILTFPALLTVVSPVVANATSTLALVPGSMASAWGYRKEFRKCGAWPFILMTPSIAGAVCGALLLTRFDEKYFSALVPWLILTATLLFLGQPLVSRWARQATGSRNYWLLVVVLQFFTSIYGGYFGAGMGIVALAVFTMLPLANLHQMNALKSFLGVCLNGAAVVVFVIEDRIAWELAPGMAISAIIGGYVGARWALRLRADLVRWLVVAIGFALSAYYFVK